MLYPVITVKDNCSKSKREHIVGTNSHDTLFISKGGGIHYLNSQAMVGTQYPEEGYSFVGEDKGEWSITCRPEIKMVTLDELIDMASEHLEESTKTKIKIYKALRKHWDDEMQKCREETGIGYDTGGLLP
jgi:hypothetical protein